MATKKKSKTAGKSASSDRDDQLFDALLSTIRAASTRSPIDARRELLAKVAGSVAAGFAFSPSPSITGPTAWAAASLEIAEEILAQAGIPDDPAAEGDDRGAA